MRYNRAHDEKAAAAVVVNSEFCKEQECLRFPRFRVENSRASKFQDFFHISVSEFQDVFHIRVSEFVRSFRTFFTSEFRSLFGVYADQSFKVSKFSRLFADRSSLVSEFSRFLQNRVSEFWQTENFHFFFPPPFGRFAPRAGEAGGGGGIWASSIGVYKRTLHQTRILSLAVQFNILAFSLDKYVQIVDSCII